MDEDNKIITFDANRKKHKYKLKVEFSIYICRTNDKYTVEWDSPDSDISHKELYSIQEQILKQLAPEIPQIQYKAQDSYEISFTLLYFEQSKNHFHYVCLPQNIKKEKLAEYLVISTSMYGLKNLDP